MNPFKVLGALPTDSRKQLQEKRDGAQLSGRQEAADAAYAALIRPQSRLEAELRWFPEKKSKTELPLWQINRLMEKADTANRRRLVMQVCECWGKQDDIALLDAINADREAGGWKSVQLDEMRLAVRSYLDETAHRLDDLYQYDTAMEERVRKLSKIKANEMRQKGQAELIRVYADDLLTMIDRCQKGKTGYAGNELLETLVDCYELHFAARADQLRQQMMETAAARENPPPGGWKSYEISQLLSALREWSTLTMPARKLTQARGMRNVQNEEVADEIRLFMAVVFNDFNNRLAAKQLIYALRKCFPEYEWLQGQLKEDEKVIYNSEQLKKIEKRENREKKLMPFGILCIILAVLMNRCSPEEPPKQSTLPVPSQQSLREAQVFFTNQNLKEMADEIERQEEFIRTALIRGIEVDFEYLNEELTKLRAEYAARKLEAEGLLKESQQDD